MKLWNSLVLQIAKDKVLEYEQWDGSFVTFLKNVCQNGRRFLFQKNTVFKVQLRFAFYTDIRNGGQIYELPDSI